MSSQGRPRAPDPALLHAAIDAAEKRVVEAEQAVARLAHAEAEAAARARAQSRFMRALHDEFRLSLRGVLAVGELLQRQPLTGEAPGYLRVIADQSRNLLRLMEQTEELAAADRGELTLRPEPVRLRDLLDEVQLEWRARAAEEGVALGAVFLGDAACVALLDAGRLRRIYAALIEHALQLTRRGGVEVSLSASREGDRVHLRGYVRDTGPGVEPAQLSTLFQPFAQGRRTPHRAGLDLALAREMVEAMGGRIWAENNGGSGLTIFFDLDAGACDASAEGAAPTDDQASPALSIHVLIVDDNATNRTVARTLVEMFGCTVETAEDGIVAVEAVARGRFDVVLMDIRMPRLDGVGAARAIRALPGPRSATPIIALTANADPEDARAYAAAGMAGLVEKPIKAERLLVALQDAVAHAPLVDSDKAAA